MLLKVFTYKEDYINSSDLCDLWVLTGKVEHAVKEELEGCYERMVTIQEVLKKMMVIKFESSNDFY